MIVAVEETFQHCAKAAGPVRSMEGG
jgi:hypothetical protein